MPDEVVYPKFQSTLLQEERPSSLSLYLSYCLISIHAPTRGATILHRTTAYHFQSTLLQEERRSSTVLFVSSFTISIHAPTRGATKTWKNLRHGDRYFNPRSYKRSDGERMKGELTPKQFQSTLLQEERRTRI